MKFKFAVAAAPFVLVLATPFPASADGPLPRGPVGGGCGAGFTIITVEDAAAISPGAGAVALESDFNQDGQVCIKFLNRRPSGGGTLVENAAVGRG
jgi:hypothetical protein